MTGSHRKDPSTDPVGVEPFTVSVPDDDIDDLRRRLADTRWPDAETVDDSSQGQPLSVARDLCAYWMTDYDWRRAESRINSLPQYRSTVDGLDIHLMHVRSPH